MPLFGKKKETGKDIEAAEEDGLLMSTAGVQPEAPAEPAPAPPPRPVVEEEPLNADDEISDAAAAALAGGEEEEEEAAQDNGNVEPAEPARFSVSAESEEGDDNILSMFTDQESYGELAELTKDIDDVSMSDLLAELREIRSALPSYALEEDNEAA